MGQTGSGFGSQLRKPFARIYLKQDPYINKHILTEAQNYQSSLFSFFFNGITRYERPQKSLNFIAWNEVPIILSETINCLIPTGHVTHVSFGDSFSAVGIRCLSRGYLGLH